MTNENNQENMPSELPDNPSEVFDSVVERDSWRKRAVDIAREKADDAQTTDERDYYLDLAAKMSDIRFELQEFFPEVFGLPDDKPEQTDE